MKQFSNKYRKLSPLDGKAEAWLQLVTYLLYEKHKGYDSETGQLEAQGM